MRLLNIQSNNKRKNAADHRAGFSLAELVVALALFGIFAGGTVVLIAGAYASTIQSEKMTQAALTIQEVFEAIDSIGDEHFNQLQTGTYSLDDSSGEWELSTDPASGDYAATVQIEDVNRDGSGDTAETGTDDPHTRKLTSTVDWNVTSSRSQTATTTSYTTDWESSEIEDDTESDFSAGTIDNVEITNADDGEVQLLSSHMEVGKVENVDHEWTVVSFEEKYENPVVVTRVLQVSNTSMISTRVRNVDASSGTFEVRLQEPSRTNPDIAVNEDDVYYMMVEEGTWAFGDDGTMIQAGFHTTNTVSDGVTNGFNNFDTLSFDNEFNSNPVVMHQVMTYNDSEWITSFISNESTRSNPPGVGGLGISLHGSEVNDSHAEETIGWIGIDGGVESTVDGLDFETVITPDEVNHTTHTYSYQSGTLSDPYVIVTKLEEDGGDGAWEHIENISTTSVSMSVWEDTINDIEQTHTAETMGYFASGGSFSTSLTSLGFGEPTMEVGTATTNSGVSVTMEAGSVGLVDGSSWTSVVFTNPNFIDPIVVAVNKESDSSGTDDPISVRIDNVTSTGFDVTLQAPDGSTPSAQDVYYLAVERGQWFIDGFRIEADSASTSTVGHASVLGGSAWQADSKSYQHTYSSAPIVLHQVQTADDTNWITSWVSSPTSQSSPPTTSGFRIAMNGAEVVASHGAETVGWIAIDSNVEGSIGGVTFETQLTSDSVGGHSNGCYTFSYNVVNDANSFAIASQEEMDGADGSWGVECDQGSNFIGVHAEEDAVYDAERSHTTETFGFISFSDETTATSDEGWTTINLQQSYTSPVIIITRYELLNDDPLSARIQNVGSNSFEVLLQHSNGVVGYEDTVYYMVIEEGEWVMGNTKIEAHKEEISTLAYSTVLGGSYASGESQTNVHNFDTDPVVLSQVMSYNDSDWVTTFVSRDGDQSNPPEASGFQIAMNGAEATTSHDPETIGWVVVDVTSGDEYNGVEFMTSVETGATEMSGHDNGCNMYTLGGSYTNPIPIGSQLGMDGNDGSWLSMCDLDTSSAFEVGFHAEEDTVYDSERSHTTESFGYVVFEEIFDIGGDSSSFGTFTSDNFGPATNYHIIEWSEDVSGCTDCDIQLQIRTADSEAELSSALWSGDTGAGTYYENASGDLINTDHIEDSYIQYRAILEEGSSGGSPVLEDVSIFYTP